jgi:dolichyl-phosphate-mannose-protein mannosyltransferase
MTVFSRKLAITAAALVLLLCLAPMFPAALTTKAMADGQNLLTNGTFEDNDGTVPDDWVTDCWSKEDGYSLFSMDLTGGADGKAAVCIENVEVNDARFTQEVAVKKGTLYKLSGDIKVEGADGTFGATLSFKDTFTHTDPLFDTKGQWKHVEVYARASTDQTKTTIFVRLGGYGSTCHGKAWFDNVVLEEVDSLPNGAKETSMATNSSSSSTTTTTQENKDLPLIIIIALLFGAAMLYAFKYMKGKDGSIDDKRIMLLYALGALVAGDAPVLISLASSNYDMWLHLACIGLIGVLPAVVLWMMRRKFDEGGKRWTDLAFIAYIALVVRMTIALAVRGYPNDIDCWLGWSNQAAGGLFTMYNSTGFNDYPPGYMYVLWLVGKINSLIPVSSLQILMCKMPSIAADLITGYFIYRLAIKRTNYREALILGLLYVFNPLIILDSSAWGQIDSILALIVVLCLWQVYNNNMWKAALIFGVGLLVKPQMLLFGPVMLGALIVAGYNAGSFKKGALIWLKTIGAGLAGFIIPALPFWIAKGDPMWLINIYVSASGTYKDASINACNLLALFGGNWVADSQTVFGLPYAVWGYMGMTIVCLFTIYMMAFRERSNRRIFLWAALLISGLFVMGLRMHERYMYPALALLLVYYVLERDRRALYLFGMFSITQFLNVAMVLANEHMSSDVLRFDWFAIANPESAGLWVFLISVAAAVAFAYMVYASWKANKPLLDVSIPDPDETTQYRLDRIKTDLALPLDASRIHLKKKDWLLMGGLTLVYAIVAVVYLGTTQVPKNMWPAMHTDDYAVIDLGKEWAVGEVWHYDGLTKGDLQISVSSDGVNWTDQLKLQHSESAGQSADLGIYKWTINTVDFEARYIKLTVTTPPVRLLEIVFKDPTGNIITPAGITDASEKTKTKEAAIADAKGAIDEQAMTPDRPSFYNSMYFDEIYHARTGWEFTQGLTPYENTHPPLGKDLIALGIWIFGMNPFGWRIMGTLMGILMVPAMYLFGMAVFRRTRYAFITAFLMTFDFMHFVQTRIATIDSYSVLFIILTFLCMYLYLHSNYNTQKLRRTFLPLALSGLFFGFASASKWIGLYAGAGLAVLFFYSIYRRWTEYKAVRDGEVEVEEDVRQGILKGFAKKTILTILWCGLFFIIIPGIIYFASYIPFNIGSYGHGLQGWDKFQYAWDNQSSMYIYHSTLVDNHFFKSPWYQWPFMIKPMWFYKADNLPSGWMGSIATFGNPAVWWAGTAALVWLVLRVYRNRKFGLPEAFILVGFLTEFLPWVLVTRTMFIYHYFASVPFFVIAIVMYIREWENKEIKTDQNSYMQFLIALAAATVVSVFMSLMLTAILAVLFVIAAILYRKREEINLYKKDLTFIYLAVVLALFILFYPVLSGMPIPSWYGALVKWMPTWYFTY